MVKVKDLIKLIRPHHYIKNLLVLAPLIFSGKMFDLTLLARAGVGFVSFSLLASTVYIINDYCDIEADRQHPMKKQRPLASGRVSKTQAIALMLGLLALAFGVLWWLPNPWLVTMVMVAYLVINLAYSFGFKHVPIIDVAIIAGGFLLRVLHGGAVCDIYVSTWLYLTVLVFSFYLALGKRRGELAQNGAKSRKVLRYYSTAFLTDNMNIFLALTLAFYSLWSTQSGVRWTVATVPVGFLITMRYSLIISDKKSSADPAEVLLRDKILLGLVMLYGLMMFAIMYLKIGN